VEGELRFARDTYDSYLSVKGSRISLALVVEISIPGVRGTLAGSGFYWKELRYVSFSQEVRVIQEGAFKGCSNLAGVVLSSSLTIIGRAAFNWCSNLRDIRLPPSLKLIRDWAFCCCSKMEEVHLPPDVVRLEYSVFSHCHQLRKVSFGQRLDEIDRMAFFDCRSLAVVDLTASRCRSIGFSAFSPCERLHYVGLPAALESIGAEAFEKTALNVVKMGHCERLNWVRYGAFGNIKKLETFILPEHHFSTEGDVLKESNAVLMVDIVECSAMVIISHLRSSFRLIGFDFISMKECVRRNGGKMIYGEAAVFGSMACRPLRPGS
jgi:hypothetical protein